MASTTNPVLPFLLSWRISHIKKATKGITKMDQKIIDAAGITLN